MNTRVLSLALFALSGLALTSVYAASKENPINPTPQRSYTKQGTIVSFCRESTGLCYEGEFDEKNGIFRVFVSINGVFYTALPDPCVETPCKDRFVTATKNLLEELQRHFPDMKAGDVCCP